MKPNNKLTIYAGLRVLLVIPAIFTLLLMFSFTGMGKTNSLNGKNTIQTTVKTSNAIAQMQQQKPGEKRTVKFTPPQISKNHEEAMTNPEHSPEYRGGMVAMQKYLAHNLHYPKMAEKAKIQGTVMVQFIISKTGKVESAKVLRGIGLECDKEALRVVRAMPDWKPGHDHGKAVPVIFTLPIKYQLALRK